MKTIVVCLLIALLVACNEAVPYGRNQDDLVAAASGYDTKGRVQIKVYRGPSTKSGYKETFAPHGYWVQEPANADGHKGYDEE